MRHSKSTNQGHVKPHRDHFRIRDSLIFSALVIQSQSDGIYSDVFPVCGWIGLDRIQHVPEKGINITNKQQPQQQQQLWFEIFFFFYWIWCWISCLPCFLFDCTWSNLAHFLCQFSVAAVCSWCKLNTSSICFILQDLQWLRGHNPFCSLEGFCCETSAGSVEFH